jgi:hypothetical protein
MGSALQKRKTMYTIFKLMKLGYQHSSSLISTAYRVQSTGHFSLLNTCSQGRDDERSTSISLCTTLSQATFGSSLILIRFQASVWSCVRPDTWLPADWINHISSKDQTLTSAVFFYTESFPVLRQDMFLSPCLQSKFQPRDRHRKNTFVSESDEDRFEDEPTAQEKPAVSHHNPHSF